MLTRRILLGSLPLVAATAAVAQPADPRLGERSLGDAGAPVTCLEFFSFTCPHCAAFARDTFPQIKTELIAKQKLRFVFREFPLDQLALTASMVARSLPAERYEPFMAALLASQDRWAYARNVNPTDELAKLAALAGMPRDQFFAVIGDDRLKRAILAEQDADEKKYGIDSTPSFVINGRKVSGEISFADFAKRVSDAA